MAEDGEYGKVVLGGRNSSPWDNAYVVACRVSNSSCSLVSVGGHSS